MTIKHIRYCVFNLLAVLLLILVVGACSPEPVEQTRSGQSGFGLNGDSEPDDFIVLRIHLRQPLSRLRR